MRLWAGLAAAGFALALPAAASAQTPEWLSGVYLGGALGWNLAEDSDIDGTGLNGDVEFNDGYAGFLTFGGKLFWFRGEGEFGYRNNDVDSVTGIGSANGKAKVLSYMGNLLFDIPTGTPWVPYVGAGIGGARLDLDSVSLPAAGVSVDDDETGWAWQGIAGVTYHVSDNLGIFADYRYFDTEDIQFRASNGTSFETDYTAHTISIGLRYVFGAPKPAPAPVTPVAEPKPAPAQPPAAAPAPVQVPRTYLVFFDWNKADIRPEAQRIIETAAANRKTANVTRLEVTGHADRSGSDRYNERLSMRRAEAVRAELVRLGVPASEIAIFAKGEREPLVQTPDGVREPQNRRVEIVLK
jgi:outer membrane protein OmpA-like peptidoglycan-associated protein